MVTDDCVIFACDRHHAEMSQAKVIRLERMKGKEAWEEISELNATICQEEYPDDLTDFKDIDDYE